MKDDYGSQELYYGHFYHLINVQGGGVASNIFKKLHKKMEKPYNKSFYPRVLEIGAGSAEHLEFVTHGFKSYILTDIRETVLPSKYEKDPRISQIVADAESLPFPNSSFDKIKVTCLLHHVENPEKVLNEILRLLSETGKAMIYLPCDPGLAVRFIRNLTTARAARKIGFKGFNLLMAREHRNHVGALLELIKYVFRNETIKFDFLPFKFKSWNLNGSIIIHVSCGP